MKYSHKNGVFIGNGNDGLVTVSAAESPPDEPGRLFDGNYKKGVWNIMPVSKGDHGTPIGLCVSKEYTHNLYDQLVELMKNVEEKG